MYCQGEDGNISWADRVRNGEVLKGEEERNVIQRIRKRKDNWIGHILRRNCLLRNVTERKDTRREDEEEEVSNFRTN